jgi:hypothetical protein
MNCREFEELVDFENAEAAAHAETCRRCRARLAEQQWLAKALRGVAEEARTLEAPARMEAAVMRAFREGHRVRRSWWPVWAAAATLAVAGFLAGWWLQRPLPPPPAVPVAAIPPAPAAPPAAMPRTVKRRPRAPQPRVEVATEFIPLPYGAELARLDRPRMLRMRLPRTALWSVGLPMNVERAFEPVKADVVFDEDGMARAIRFVK